MIDLKTVQNKYFELFWNNYYPKTSILYQAQPNKWILVNDIFHFDSDLDNLALSKVFKDYNMSNSDDNKALYALQWIINFIKYEGDFQQFKTAEYWQSPCQTFSNKAGDCEDGALLMYMICRILGVPSWKLRLACGNVTRKDDVSSVGHCYLSYLSQGINDIVPQWYVMDWCFYPLDSLNNFRTTRIYEDNVYTKSLTAVWWTFNEDNMWAQNDWIYNPIPKLGRIQSSDIIL